MHLLSLESVSKSYPENPVLDGVSLGVSARERIAVIGRNGSGKSTLLRIVAGDEQPDAGQVIRSTSLRVSALDQDPRFPAAATVGRVVGSRRQAIAMADRLGLTDPEAAVATLSGGQRKRLALAVALAADANLLVLDEPTNHLDIDMIEWMEDHLLGRSTALLLVTHDRYLLDRVATRVVEVHDRRLHPHQGSYEGFLEARIAREEQEAAAEHRRRQRQRVELEWLRRSPKARTSKARYRVRQAQALLATGKRPVRGDVDFDLPARRIGSKVVNLHNAGKRYGDRWVLRNVSHKLPADARIGVVGPNGAGKTTLLRLIAGHLQPDEGKVTLGTTISPGWYGQDVRAVPPATRVQAAVKEVAEHTRTADGITIPAHALLERFLFTGPMQRTPVGDLSGGERRRLELLLVLMRAPNLLLLDEPTNDLDLETLAALEEYLDGWPGALAVASHDRYFLDRVCSDIFSIEADGNVRHHPGGWSGYWQWRQDVVATAPEPAAAGSVARRRRTTRKGLTYVAQREYDQLGARIPELEARREALAGRLDAAGADYEEATRVGKELEEVLAELDAAETRWLELSEQADA